MKRFLFCCLVVYYSLGTMVSFAQSTVVRIQPASNVERLVREVFIKDGDCAQVSNIQLIGQLAGVGSFTIADRAQSIDMDAGLILSTGEVKNAIGPNQSSDWSSSWSLDYSDRDLSKLSGQDVFDATGIAFDFVPNGEQVSFNYIFASEEYCEFVNQEFNDVFGFFVSGPGLEGDFDRDAINVALIPGTQERVAINSVNHLRNTQYFISNFLDSDIERCGLPPRQGPLKDIEFDGFTRRFRAIIDVIPCETYHIRLVVGDVADNILDSGVFLEANSFDLGGEIQVRAEVPGRTDATLFENCLEGRFIFERSFLAERFQPLTVDYRLEGQATNGIDFEAIPDQITIPAGEGQIAIPIRAIADSLPEGTETVRIITENSTCDCVERDTATLYISEEVEALNLAFDEERACAGQPFQLSPRIFNGTAPFQYLWNTGDTTRNIETQIDQSEDFSITITDACLATGKAEVQVELQQEPRANLVGIVEWCPGTNEVSLPVTLEGNSPWSLSYESPDGSSIEWAGITEQPFALPVEAIGTYRLLSFQDKNCSGTVSGRGEAISKSFSLSYELVLPSCRTARDGAILINLEGGTPPYQVDWGEPVEDPFRRSFVGIGSYPLRIRDADGCEEAFVIEIQEEGLVDNCEVPRQSVYIPNAFSPNGDQINDVFRVYPRQGTFESVRFEVYDRWGGLQYRSEPIGAGDSGLGWDGGAAPVGVYLCKVQIVLSDGSVTDRVQTFQLMR